MTLTPKTKVFPKFLHWILTDPKYGAINYTKDKKEIKAIQGVIDLYKEWIDTGIKPSQELWRNAKDLLWNAAYTDSSAAGAAYAAAAGAAADNAPAAAFASASAAAKAAKAAYIDAASGIPRSEVETAQLDKLNSLIKNKYEDELFTETDGYSV